MTATLIDEARSSVGPEFPTSARDTPQRQWVWVQLTSIVAGLFGTIGLAAYTGGTGLALVYAGVVSVAAAFSVLGNVVAHTAVVAGFTFAPFGLAMRW